jgi:predicted nuclease with TOPRIM domain
MSRQFTGGFFFNPKGSKPSDIVARIDTDQINPYLDDLFTVSLQETVDEADAVRKKMMRFAARRVEIERGLKELEDEHERLENEFKKKRAAIDRYQDGDDVPAILYPKCEQLAKAKEAEVAKKELESARFDPPKGWEISNERCDDEYLYVTVRRRREARPIEIPEQIKKKVKDAYGLYEQPDFDREARIQSSLQKFQVLSHFNVPP